MESTWEVKTEQPKVYCQPQLHSEYEVRLGSKRPCFKTNHQREKVLTEQNAKLLQYIETFKLTFSKNPITLYK